MAANSNPYERWLGIPPTEQPPSHYRLLGLKQFESDPDVIRSAADRVMDGLQELSDGEHDDERQRLLAEVAAARGCLLQAGEKEAYDAALRQKTAKRPAAGKAKPADGKGNQPPAFLIGRPVPLPKKRGAEAERQTESDVDEPDTSDVAEAPSPSPVFVDVAPRGRGRPKIPGKDNRRARQKDNLVPIVAWTAGGCVLLLIVVGVILGTTGVDDGSSQTPRPAGASQGGHANPSGSSSGPRNPDPRGPYGGRSLGDLLEENPGGGTTFGDGSPGGFPDPGPGRSEGGIEPLRVGPAAGSDDAAPSVIDAVPGGE